MKASRMEAIVKNIVDTVGGLCLGAVVSVFILTTIVANAGIPTGSMENTIKVGDRVFGNRLAYLISEPKLGDVILFRFPDDKSLLYTKRIIGVPNDVIDIRDGKVYLNNSDTPVYEPYLKEPMIDNPDMHFEVPDNSYFCMGDNRNNSADSRYWNNKFVSIDDIIAKVEVSYFPNPRIIK